MSIYDWIHVAVMAFCVFHSVIEFFRARKLNKRIEKICSDCGSPVIEGEDHQCVLTPAQLQALTSFVLSLKKGDENNG